MRKRQQYDGESSVVSELMRYFNEQGVEAVIIDNRINGGFFNTQSFIELFGGKRTGIEDLHAFQDQDNRDSFNVDTQIEVWSGTTTDNQSLRRLADTAPWASVRPDLLEERYPGSVFKNGPVIILDSQSAGSGGDQLPRFFMGDNLDGDIGNGVTTKIVGTIDGILEGYSSGNNGLIVSKYGSEFGDTPITIATEGLLYNLIGNVPTSTRINPATGKPITSLVPVNSNLAGPLYSSNNTGSIELVQGALSTNLSDTVFFDFGYTGEGQAVDGTRYTEGHWDNPPVGIEQVDGFPGQPDPTVAESLRDSWFEEALRVTRLCLGDELTEKRAEPLILETPSRSGQVSPVTKICMSHIKTLEDMENLNKKRDELGKRLKGKGAIPKA